MEDDRTPYGPASLPERVNEAGGLVRALWPEATRHASSERTGDLLPRPTWDGDLNRQGF